MSLWVPHSAFLDWHADFGLSSLKYSYNILNANFGVGKPVIIIDSCVVKSWLTFANLQNVSQTTKPPPQYISNIYICTLKQHSMSTCKQEKGTQRHLVKAEKAISNYENCMYLQGCVRLIHCILNMLTMLYEMMNQCISGCTVFYSHMSH